MCPIDAIVGSPREVQVGHEEWDRDYEPHPEESDEPYRPVEETPAAATHRSATAVASVTVSNRRASRCNEQSDGEHRTSSNCASDGGCDLSRDLCVWWIFGFQSSHRASVRES